MNRLDLFVKETLDSLKKLLITLGVFFLILLLTWCAAVNEKRTVELTAKFDEGGNVVVFPTELDDDDYIAEISAYLYKNGEKIKEYDLELKCSDKISDCAKEAEKYQSGRQWKMEITDKNEIVFPKGILDKGSFSIYLRTYEHDREHSSLGFCVKNNELIAESDSRFVTLCSPDFPGFENQQQSASQEVQQ